MVESGDTHMNVCLNNKNTLYNHDLNVCIADRIYLIEVTFKQNCDKRSGVTALLFQCNICISILFNMLYFAGKKLKVTPDHWTNVRVT